ncbi:MAG: hypothetical protein PGN37_11285 [Mycobacterium kyogaense]|uniref:hypothetical protein n=1 Tax=Mycobacterium kyogaense TaxID=2212479 RepID=UPI002FF765F7
MVSFSRLGANWLKWTAWSRMSNPSVSSDEIAQKAVFRSDDDTFHLRHEGNWWVLDRTNDRGRNFPGVAQFSNFQVAERYLLWQWASNARSDLASGSLGRDLYERGYAPGVEVIEIREGFVEIRAGEDAAVLPAARAIMFSHLMAEPTEEIERLINVGMPTT